MNNQRRFIEDVKRTLKYYPDLKHTPSTESFFQVEGDVPLYDDNGNLRHIFSVRVIHSSQYPKGFAKLYEIGEDIPNSIDWHKYDDHQCCVCAQPEEIIQKRKSNSIAFFIQEYGIPFLANFLHKKLYGFYPNGEYKHGSDGTMQWYQEQFQDNSISQIIEIVKTLVLTKNLPKPFHNCICGSKKKFRDCHQQVCQEIKSIPRSELMNHLVLLSRYVND